MSNPKDWFRRRRPEPAGVIPRDLGDPFEDGPVLEIARGGVMARPHDADAPRRAVPIPPPPPRPGAPLRERTGPEPAAATRPERAEIVPMPAPRTAPAAAIAEAPSESGDARTGFAGSLPGFAVRRRAVPLPRNGFPQIVPGSAPRREAEPDRRDEAPRNERAEAPPPPRREETRGVKAPMPRPAPAESREADEEVAPSFTLAAPGAGWIRGRVGGSEAGAANAVLRDAFTPTRPKRQDGLFSGRYRQMQRIIAAIEEERAHVVLHGERGGGKTSLANILAIKAEAAGYFVQRFACSSELSFDDIFRELLRRIPASFLADGVGASMRAGISTFAELLPPGEVGIPDLVRAFERLHDKHVILIIDEWDRVTSEATKNKLAELIKTLSDASVPVTLLLIGVAENVDELLGKHPSLQRTLVTVPLPLMSRREIDAILTAGEAKAGLLFEPEVRRLIVDLAQGLPYHAQLLGLFAARQAVRRRSRRVELADLRHAVQRAAEEADGKLKERYHRAIGLNSQGGSFKDVLFAAACAASDDFGVFTVGAVAAALTRDGADNSMLALQYPLKKLTDPERGAVLRRIATPEGLRYQFITQMMRHYVLIRQAEERGLL
jgi:Cdc6-like AAA superfamily ATPase